MIKFREILVALIHRQWMFLVLVSIFAITPYTLDAWWKFFPSLCAIVLLARGRSRTYLSDLGLKVSGNHAVTAAGVFALTFAIAVYAVPRLLNENEIVLYRGDQWHLGWALMPVMQSLLEELVLRALLLNALLIHFQRAKLISLLAAIIFMLWHLTFFPFTQGIWLSGTTLITLFLFGYASNNFFLAYRSIAIPFSLHCGWNVVKFGGEFFDKTTIQDVPEALAFNAVEGSSTIVALALGLVAISEFVVMRKQVIDPK